MSHRKRRTVQPMLESMEPRVVPGATGIHAHHVQAVTADVSQMNSSAKQVELSERKNNEALKHLQQQENQVHVRSLEHIPSALPTKAEQEATDASNLVKSLEGAL